MILRPDYLDALRPFIDAPMVKILSGVRRSGKSTIFLMLEEYLQKSGISEDNIISRRYTDQDYDKMDQKEMYDDLTKTIAGKGRCYLLLDEVQEIKGWEKVVNSLLEVRVGFNPVVVRPTRYSSGLT